MRVLSGIQPSGQIHLGNYFGSVKPNLEYLGKAHENIYFIVDLHAMTTVQDPLKLRAFRRDAALDLLACGFDPEKAILFFQSDVAEHSELLWVLSVVSPMGLLERAVSYKEKVEKGIASSVGLFTYPVLMAADILLYDTNLVPVGKDQKQHVEIARDIAIKFNNQFGQVFTLPEPKIREDVAVVPGTDGQKMSKSYGNTIPIFGKEEDIKKAIMGIVTDSKGVADRKDPATCTVYRLHSLFLSSQEARALADRYRDGGLGYGEAKKMLFTAYMDHFGPLRKKRDDFARDEAGLAVIMDAGAAKARKLAAEKMIKVRKAVGLR
jgi:tryptophanyl-tRNA synthetase